MRGILERDMRDRDENSRDERVLREKQERRERRAGNQSAGSCLDLLRGQGVASDLDRAVPQESAKLSFGELLDSILDRAAR